MNHIAIHELNGDLALQFHRPSIVDSYSRFGLADPFMWGQCRELHNLKGHCKSKRGAGVAFKLSLLCSYIAAIRYIGMVRLRVRANICMIMLLSLSIIWQTYAYSIGKLSRAYPICQLVNLHKQKLLNKIYNVHCKKPRASS